MMKSIPFRQSGAAAAHAFLRWWLAELAALVPSGLMAPLLRRPPSVVVDLTETAAVISIPAGGGGGRTVHCAIGEMPALGLSGPAQAIVALSPDQVLIRAIDLPLAAEPRLRTVLEFELDRQTPFLPDQVYFDHQVVERRPGEGRLTAELAVVPRLVVDQAVTLSRGWGLEPVAVGVSGEGGGGPRFDFLPTARTAQSSQRKLGTVLTLVALALVLAGAMLWHGRRESVLEALAADLASARQEARISEQLRQRLDEAFARNRFLAERQRQVRAIHVLAEITRLLPDDSWLFEAELSGQDGRIVGYSPSASPLIPLFAQSPLFADARFRAPLIQGDNGLERFDLSFTIRKPGP